MLARFDPAARLGYTEGAIKRRCHNLNGEDIEEPEDRFWRSGRESKSGE